MGTSEICGWDLLALWGSHGLRASGATFLSLSFHTWKLGRVVPACGCDTGMKGHSVCKGAWPGTWQVGDVPVEGRAYGDASCSSYLIRVGNEPSRQASRRRCGFRSCSKLTSRLEIGPGARDGAGGSSGGGVVGSGELLAEPWGWEGVR